MSDAGEQPDCWLGRGWLLAQCAADMLFADRPRLIGQAAVYLLNESQAIVHAREGCIGDNKKSPVKNSEAFD